MICTQCGCEQAVGAHFCQQCGVRFEAAMPQQAWTSAGAPPAMPYLQEQRLRIWQNLQPLGIMWCLFGVYRLVRGIVAATVLGAMVHNRPFLFGDAPDFVPHIFAALLPVVAVTSVALAALSVLTGYGLLTRKPWGRTLGIVMGILMLIKLPLGTALGIYTLWVLAPSASGAEWQRGAAPAGVSIQ